MNADQLEKADMAWREAIDRAKATYGLAEAQARKEAEEAAKEASRQAYEKVITPAREEYRRAKEQADEDLRRSMGWGIMEMKGGE